MNSSEAYRKLGLEHGATLNEVKSAWRRLSRKYHPDRSPNNSESEEKFKEISEAYSIISNFLNTGIVSIVVEQVKPVETVSQE